MLAIRLPPEIEARLDSLAKATGRTKSYYVREALVEHLADLEDLYMAETRLRKIRAGAFQNRFRVVQDQSRFMLDIAERNLVVAGIDGHLSRHIHKTPGFNCRRIRTTGHGNTRRTQSLDHAYCPSASRNLSASIAAMQPAPDAVIACRYVRS